MIPRPRGPRGARLVAGENADVGVAVQALAAAVLVMATGVVVCLVVAPKPVAVRDGLSWFG